MLKIYSLLNSKIKSALTLLKHNFLFTKMLTLNIPNRFKFEILEKPVNKIKFSIGIFVILTTIIGFFGIRPELKNLLSTLRLRNDLIHKKVFLETKQKTLRDYEKTNSELSDFVGRLNTAMPTSPDIETYLISVNQTTNLNEMYINSLTTSLSKNNTVLIEAIIYGKTEKIKDLINAIETFKRITKIKSVEMNNSGTDSYIKIKAEIYYSDSEGSKKPLDIYQPISGKIDVEFLRGF